MRETDDEVRHEILEGIGCLLCDVVAPPRLVERVDAILEYVFRISPSEEPEHIIEDLKADRSHDVAMGLIDPRVAVFDEILVELRLRLSSLDILPEHLVKLGGDVEHPGSRMLMRMCDIVDEDGGSAIDDSEIERREQSFRNVGIDLFKPISENADIFIRRLITLIVDE